MQNTSETDEHLNSEIGVIRRNVERAREENQATTAAAQDSIDVSPERWPKPRIIYSPQFNMPAMSALCGVPRGLRRDSRKYAGIWAELRQKFGEKIDQYWMQPARGAGKDELARVHSAQYLDSLKSPKAIAAIMASPRLGLLPRWAIDRFILEPMRFATMGTVMAVDAALEHGIALNIAGGFHQATSTDGYGGCVYSDVALAITELRRTEKLSKRDCVAYIDVSARQGLGVCRSFLEDRRVFIYDQYNVGIFPYDIRAQERIDCDVPVKPGATDKDYIEEMQFRLPRFLDAVTIGGNLKLAIYHLALETDESRLARGINLTERGMLARDKLVLKELTERRIPTAILLGGAYGAASQHLAAERAVLVLKKWGGLVEK